MLKFNDLKDKRYFNGRFIVPALKNAGQDKLAYTIEHCSYMSEIAVCQNCGKKYFAGSFYCKSRFCSICAKLRAMAWLSKLIPLFNEYTSKGYKVFMLNLTIKDQEDLGVGLSALLDAWRYMSNGEKSLRQKFKELNVGGVRSVEVKLGKGSGIWHPHIHSLVLCKVKRGEYVQQFNDYKKLWECAVRSAFNCSKSSEKLGSVDIRGIRSGNNKGLMGAIVETFKYISKFTWLSLEPDKINELIEKTKGRRFISSWGKLYGLNKQVEELLNRTTEEELKDKVCIMCGCSVFELEHILTDLISEEHLNQDL